MCVVNIAFLAKVLLLIYTSPVIGSSNCRPSASNDAWKFLETFKEGYIRYTTVNLHEICHSFDQIQLDTTTKEAVYSVTTLSTDNDHAKSTENKIIQVQDCPTDVKVYLQSSGEPIYNVTFAYSDYATCTILHHHDATNACSMLVNQGANQDTIEACLAPFVKYCGKFYYQVYFDFCNKIRKLK